MRVYKGTNLNGHLTLFKGEILRGKYADDAPVAQFVPKDPMQLFAGSSSLVLRFEIPSDERSTIILLRYLGPEPRHPDIATALARCRGGLQTMRPY
jgi:hypothetical protein